MINQQNIDIENYLTQAKELAKELTKAITKVINTPRTQELELTEENIEIEEKRLELEIKKAIIDTLKQTKDINEEIIEELTIIIREKTEETLIELTKVLTLEEEIEKETKKALEEKLEKTLTQGIIKTREKTIAKAIRETIEGRAEWETEEMKRKSEASKRGWETKRQKGTDKKKKLKPIKPSIQWLTAKETMTLAEISRTTMYKKIKAGEFPKPIKIGKKSLWVEHEINDWIKEQMGLPTSINI